MFLCSLCSFVCGIFGYLVFSAFLMYFVCEFEIVQYIPLFVVCWGLLRMMFGGVRFAG